MTSRDAAQVRRLTSVLASALRPTMMRLEDMDRLYNAADTLAESSGVWVDVVAMRKLAETMDAHRRLHRLIRTGVVPGQLDFDGNEVPEPRKETL